MPWAHKQIASMRHGDTEQQQRIFLYELHVSEPY